MGHLRSRVRRQPARDFFRRRSGSAGKGKALKLNREELLEQKRLIETQLKWIETKLRELDDSAQPGASTDHEVKPPMEKPLSRRASPAPVCPFPAGADGTAGADREFERFAAANTSNPAMVKIGCVGLVVLMSALALFVLFGLPYLLAD